jgi:predicted Rossmann-fold nucleotide-binding protein
VNGYYDRWRETVQHMADCGFIAQTYADMLIYAPTTAEALDRFRTYEPPPPKWNRAPVEQRY